MDESREMDESRDVRERSMTALLVGFVMLYLLSGFEVGSGYVLTA